MLGRLSNRGQDAKATERRVLHGGIRKSYFQRLRRKVNRLRHGTGSVNYLDYLRVDLIEKGIFHIHDFGCNLLDVLTRPLRKASALEQSRRLTTQVNSQPRPFTQYLTKQQEEGKWSTANDAKPSISTLSPFAAKGTKTLTNFIFASLSTASCTTFDSTASWARSPITVAPTQPNRVEQSTQISLEINPEKHQQGQLHLVTSSRSTTTAKQQSAAGSTTWGSTASWQRTLISVSPCKPSQGAQESNDTNNKDQQHTPSHAVTSSISPSKLQQQCVPQTASIETARRTNLLGPSAELSAGAYTTVEARSTRTSQDTVNRAATSTNCGVAHCATSHWHEPSTVKNPFESPPTWIGTVAPGSSLMQSIHRSAADSKSRKRPYFDYDSDGQYYGQMHHLKRLRYNDVSCKGSESETTAHSTSEDDDTDVSHQSRSLVSYQHAQIHVKAASPIFSRHELHTFGVALVHLRQDTCVGDGEYPHEFENRGSLLLRGRPPYFTFPLLPPGETYGGRQRPGPDRVILDGDHTYVNIVAHDHSVLGGFRLIC